MLNEARERVIGRESGSVFPPADRLAAVRCHGALDECPDGYVVWVRWGSISESSRGAIKCLTGCFAPAPTIAISMPFGMEKEPGHGAGSASRLGAE